jgi:hypothetical protein
MSFIAKLEQVFWQGPSSATQQGLFESGAPPAGLFSKLSTLGVRSTVYSEGL